MRVSIVAAIAAGAIAAPAASAQTVSITVENTSPAGGFSVTPFWLALHDGSFDAFDTGAAAGAGIMTIAELGDTSVVSGALTAAQASAVQTTLAEPNGAPVFSPGESASTTLSVGDPTVNRFFSYASMVVPSNDMFVGNDGAIELFDAAGNFNGPLVIEIYGSDVWDAGSEVNDIANGAAFVDGLDATLGADEGGVVTAFFSGAGATDYLNSIVGATTADGGSITSAFGRDDLIARITITPAPGGVSAMLLAGVVAAGRRRRG